MTDREKIIEDIEDGVLMARATSTRLVHLFVDKAEEIVELLKEQEAVEPSFKQDEKGIFVWCCGSCGAYMYHIYDGIDKAKEYAKFCRQCGKPVLWECR